MGTLTVKENIAFSANLRLPHAKYDKEARAAKVDKVIKQLGLESCADTKVFLITITKRSTLKKEKKEENNLIDLTIL